MKAVRATGAAILTIFGLAVLASWQGCGVSAVPDVPEELRQVCSKYSDWEINNYLELAREGFAEGYTQAQMLAIGSVGCGMGVSMFGEQRMTEAECKACDEAVVDYVYR